MCDAHRLPLHPARTCHEPGTIEQRHPWTGVVVRVCGRCYAEMYKREAWQRGKGYK